ncbi:uncharacterized protein [Pseudorasbora parva]|uniref:uncharacterized protein n=1 Tax=Pseudorasbora parva TaxID=51549 RepID=UPI00351F04BB
MDEYKDGDRASQKSAGSSRTSVSTASAAARARARAEAACVRASFAEKEGKLKIEQAEKEAKALLEKARLTAELSALTLQREAAAAVAQAKILEAAEEQLKVPDDKSAIRSYKEESMQRTNDYVTQQAELQKHSHRHEFVPVKQEESLVTWDKSLEPLPLIPHSQNQVKSPERCITMSDSYFLPLKISPNIPETNNEQWPHPQSGAHTNLYTTAQPYTPLHYASRAESVKGPPMTEFVKFLARRELVTTGLRQFDDRPESFRAWQSSFLNAIKELDISASEELDLLTKWLGKESGHYVNRIRLMHVNNPQVALRKAWDRLVECYASPEIIEDALFKKLDMFTKISNNDFVRLRELGDLLMEILSAKQDGYLPGLAFLDTARGISPIVAKLSHSLQDKWVAQGSRFKTEHNGVFPPFSFFAEFICYEARIRNDPSFSLTRSSDIYPKERPILRMERIPLSTHKTDVLSDKRVENPGKYCPIHNRPHPLKKCRTFRAKHIDERKSFLRENGICYRCCTSTSHLAKDCKVTVMCSECESNRHVTVMHPGPPCQVPKSPTPQTSYGAEGDDSELSSSTVTSHCTEICGKGQPGKSCSKICLVQVFPQNHPEKVVKMYAILDDQSNRSLANTEFFELFGIESEPSSYSLRTCAGVTNMSGRKAECFMISPAAGGASFALPPLIECNQILASRCEIPTPNVVLNHAHLKSIASQIPKLDPNAQILLLLGRDIIRVHKVRQQINGPHDAPFAQRLDLGWVVVGEVCLGNAHIPSASTFRTNILENGRTTYLSPCTSYMNLKEEVPYSGETRGVILGAHKNSMYGTSEDSLGCDVFQRTENDNKLAPSIEDTAFLRIMNSDVHKDEENSWVAPLPFREPRQMLPNNREQALNRFHSLQRTFTKKPEMEKQFVSFMKKILENDHAELAPPLKEGEECWFLPIFAVYHPKKPDQIRVVFDSSAQHHGISLNNVLLTGPDLNNNLLGVLLRFRKETVAITADIQQMFHCFKVREDHRNFLRFFWFRDSDPTKDVIEYRMKVHVFGNSPSPAVAIYGLRRAASEGENVHGSDTRQFVERHFYVDDGLVSLPTDDQAVSLLQRTRASLAESNLRLHKIASNSPAVMQAFPQEEHAKTIKDLDLSGEIPLVQRTLGLCWEIVGDTFTYDVSTVGKPFTRRGVLSTVNSIFDPLGIASPVTIQGRALLRELSNCTSEWDDVLPEEKRAEWGTWQDSLKDLRQLHIPRTYTSISLSKAKLVELCIFSDASTKAIGAVAYLRVIDHDGNSDVGFVLGKSKLAPQHKPTIPRLELCAAVLAVEIADLIRHEMDLRLHAVRFYCDSKVVLGYIHNETKRFYVYVYNRVHRIRQSSRPEQWFYIPTELNPADHASRGVAASQLNDSAWLKGPSFLSKPYTSLQEAPESYKLVCPEQDVEIRQDVLSYCTQIRLNGLGTERFQRFSTWKTLVRAIALLIHIVRTIKSKNGCEEHVGWHRCDKLRTSQEYSLACNAIFRATQQESFPMEYAALSERKALPKNSPLLKLDPVLKEGLIRIGGRLENSPLSSIERNPLVLPKHNHISSLLVHHYHEKVEHQGRHFTEGALRRAGFWIIGGKRLISSILHHCVTCRKLRRKMEEQIMADLPPERLNTNPPFTYVGLDVFGPWMVSARRTRGGHAESKRWAILFTCMSIRAVHIEVIESMDASSCINALRRFFSIRGPAKQLRSDCGTNFVGASKELGLNKLQQEEKVLRYLSEQGCSWEFNPPHSSHRGGSWERMIGVARRILDHILLREHTPFSHEVLCTLMAEVSAIINARPLIPVSSDPESPFILTPAVLLTQKGAVPPPPGKFGDRDLLLNQWRQVQALANEFWLRWKREYLPTLQSRRKWNKTCRNLQAGDVVLLKDNQAARNTWPMAVVTSAIHSQDGKVRTVSLRTTAQGTPKAFTRPVTEVVLLLPSTD